VSGEASAAPSELGLPPELQQAIDSRATVLRVLGAAGTGKSLVIARRVLRLLREGAAAQDIKVVTASRTAAVRLRAALASSGIEYAAEVSVGTIGELCQGILAAPAAIASTGRIPRLVNAVEELFLLEDLKAALDAPGLRPAQLREMLESLYRGWAELASDGVGPSGASFAQAAPCDYGPSGLASLRAVLTSLLVSRQAMLGAELPFLTWRYLDGLGDGRAALCRPHVLVDDYQDLSRASQAVVGLLYARSLTVSGNPHQAQALTEPYPCPQGLLDEGVPPSPEGATVVLTRSLRCPQHVAAAGNALVLSLLEHEGTHEDTREDTPEAPREVPHRDGSELLAAFDETVPLGRITAVKWTDPQQECTELCSWLKQRINDDADPLGAEDVLVIVPNRVWGRQFAKRLDALRLAHEDRYDRNPLRGNPQRPDASAGMRSYTLLTLAAHPDDAVAWRSWCGFGARQANSAAWHRLVQWAAEQGIGISQALRRLAQAQDTRQAQHSEPPFEHSELLAEAWRRADAILGRCEGKRGERLLGLVCDGDDPTLDGFESLVRPLDGDETALDLYERARQQLCDPVFVRERRLRIAVPQTAQGLEARLVVITGMVNGFVPTACGPAAEAGGEAGGKTGGKAGDEAGGHSLQWERRALYDTLSRSSSELVLSCFQKADEQVAERLGMAIRRLRPEPGGRKALLLASSFLDEMGRAVPGMVARLP
jgi:DNA helicase-2/ATP-dependent DNA helicase PcrA